MRLTNTHASIVILPKHSLLWTASSTKKRKTRKKVDKS